MKVVIDIPEDDYKLACNYPDALIACYAHYIKDGIPLKGHGRLIDADALKKRVKQGWVPEEHKEIEAVLTMGFLSDINEQATVIEAEGEDFI